MAILTDLLDNESTTAWIRSVAESVAYQVSDLEPVFETMNIDYGSDADLVIYSDLTPPLGVYSVGAIYVEGRWQPGILVTEQFIPDSAFDLPLRAGVVPGLIDLLSDLGGGGPPDNVWVVGIPAPDEQAIAVDADQEGTLGAAVTLADGSRGALTAGHVAQSVGDEVEIVGVGPAEVAFSSHRHLLTCSDQTCADVAVLRFDTDAIDFPDVPGLGTVAGMERVRAYNRSHTGAPSGQPFRFAGESFPVKVDEGAWGDFMMIDPPVSVEGDSGALAINDRDEAVGQVVGGKAGAYSIVQPISYLLKESETAFDQR